MMNYNYGFNPMMTAQQRLSYMEQPQGFTTLPVSNIQEATSYRVNIDGTPTYFHNMGTGEIYIKKTNRQTGTADFEIYKKVIEEQPNGITLETLNQKIDGLYSLFNPPIEEDMKGGKK